MAKAKEASAKSASTDFTCPDCGRTFSRAAALGAHRRQAHGVIGAVAARAAASKRTRRRGRGSGSRAASGGASGNGRRTASGGQRNSADGNRVDRDGLLKTLFPKGVPARADALNAVSSWLEEAERLAAMR